MQEIKFACWMDERYTLLYIRNKSLPLSLSGNHCRCRLMKLLSLPLDLGYVAPRSYIYILPSRDLGGKRPHDLQLNFVKRNADPLGDLLKLLTFEGVSCMNIPHVSNRNWKFLSKHQRMCS